MLGFVFGTLCLVGLVKLLSAGHHGFGRGRHGRWGGGFGPRRMLRGVFERLDTSPGQEKVLADAAHEIAAAAAPVREEVALSRRDLAKALRGATLDEEALGELFARHDEVLREARKRTVGALARVHDALDERQREALAAMVEAGWRGCRRSSSGPYRGAPLGASI